ncbi:hypothetical protein PR202_ga20299 [Eleusine coracana subsp. coracana]|uniref:non-specific serine/threonine protein kinase n=1 Tax=Eleusine coracana subsp. coracana TaxID=191504 RepID=A0AAV5CYB0_ELECO|nr:hypothetical protein PR202_ga20299 [Eleusine coracana subsp. coracana]
MVMEHHCSVVLLVASLLLARPSSPYAWNAGTDTDHRALMQFRSLMTDDTYGALASWDSVGSGNVSAAPPASYCWWHGVTCGARGRRRGRVTALVLRGQGLTGSMIAPSPLADLAFLRRLDLSQNSLSGGVPTPLPVSLEYLNLSRNALQGPVAPELGSLRRLRVLSLDINNLTGTVPAVLGNLTSLAILSLTNNYLSGVIPSTLGNLRALTGLYLNYNMLRGSIPSTVFNLSSLQHLVVQTNNLTGTLPPDAGSRLPSLRLLSVDANQLHGAIPASLCNASKLEVVQMLENSFSGVIPDCLGANLKNLWAFVLDFNQLEANVDADWGFMDSLTNCSNLKFIGLAGNKLRGVLPGSIANLSTTMESLSLWNNTVSGKIPQGIGNLVNLRRIWMGTNNLSGTIPDSLGNLRMLSVLYLYDNKLSGQIPPAMGNLTVLTELSLFDNMLTGPIPSSLGNCSLAALDLQHNRLTGPIPKELVLVSTLTQADFHENMLSGLLPSEVGHLINLQVLDLSGNRLTGEIPASLGNCQILQYCVMKGNIFQGKIPDSIGQLRGLLGLDLSRNNLSGPIPDFLGTMRVLEQLDLSYNNFVGEGPEHGIFLNGSAFSVEGNIHLCGGIPQLKLPPCSINGSTSSGKRSHKLVRIIISIASTILGIAFLLSLFVLYHRKRKLGKEEHALPLISDHHVRVSYGNLVNATNCFSSENLIGIGSFGSVYKGTMMSQGREVIVAVKVLNLQQRGASQSFIAECETLRCARHRNLVKILTVCCSLDSGIRGLDLAQRIDIAIDVASALEYLHHFKPIPIVHCDLKPSNILLDNDMVAHVGDFGLARFMHEDQSSLPDIKWLGYKKGNNWICCSRYVQVALQEEQVANVVDQQLLSIKDQEYEGRTSSSSSTTEMTVACVTSVLQIGILCSKELPADRLPISDVLRELHSIKDRYNYMHLPSIFHKSE